MPAQAIPLIVAGATALTGQGINAFSTGNMNKRSMRFSREMYARQFQDNLNFWNIQNEYNSPAAQMQRFQEAGLNPHLIYGQGNSGNATPINTPDVQSPQFRTPEYGNMLTEPLAAISQIYDLDIKQAQADNLRAQNTVIAQDALLRAAQIKQTISQTARTDFDLGLDTELREISADSRRESLRQLKTNTDIFLNRDAREAAINAANLTQAADMLLTSATNRRAAEVGMQKARQEMRVMAENIKILKQDGILRELDIELRQQGINPNDPMWARIVGRVLGNWIDTDRPLAPGETKGALRQIRDNFWNWIFNK